uniref:F-box/LRR-repeat protein 15/At3g58940/PEG3-like LRR domain-containing protein n=1 Tax=Arundo donax TaxID=35708 RepID=A0A0A8XTW1_ARUDO
MPSPTVPSVRVLALKVSFRVRKLARMVPAFLRCFPNVDTLHIESGKSDSSAGKLNLSFWQCAAPIECVDTC